VHICDFQHSKTRHEIQRENVIRKMYHQSRHGSSTKFCWRRKKSENVLNKGWEYITPACESRSTWRRNLRAYVLRLVDTWARDANISQLEMLPAILSSSPGIYTPYGIPQESLRIIHVHRPLPFYLIRKTVIADEVRLTQGNR